MSSTPRTSEIHDIVGRSLDEHGVRYTHGRRSVVASIQMATGPRSAAELAQDVINDVPVSSLYRTLTILEESSIVKKHHGPDGVARYELAEWLTGHHHHVVCVACGAIEDVAVPPKAEHTLHAIVESLGSEAGYRVLDHVLEVEGVCPDCEPQSVGGSR